MGIEYYLVDEPGKRVLFLDKGYWLASSIAVEANPDDPACCESKPVTAVILRAANAEGHAPCWDARFPAILETCLEFVGAGSAVIIAGLGDAAELWEEKINGEYPWVMRPGWVMFDPFERFRCGAADSLAKCLRTDEGCAPWPY